MLGIIGAMAEEVAHLKESMTDVTVSRAAEMEFYHGKLNGCDAVMVGRGALGNPWIFAQIRAALAGEKAAAPDAHARVETALGHARGEL